MSKQLGILFKGEMVRAILECRKTQTRRGLPIYPTIDQRQLFEPSFSDAHTHLYFRMQVGGKDILVKPIKCPWQVGDYLYVRETWGVGTRPDPFQGWIDGIEYRADEAYLDEHDLLPINPVAEFDYGSYSKTGWQPSLFMPKIISRIWLKVTNVRVERLLDISIEDAKAEGITEYGEGFGKEGDDVWRNNTSVENYFWLWDSINGAGSHKKNPWVWVIEFERCEKP